jgi:hypothetical protein
MPVLRRSTRRHSSHPIDSEYLRYHRMLCGRDL